MSYTKFSKEVTKWLKENNLPCYGTAYDSPEETKARLDAWMVGMKHMLNPWQSILLKITCLINCVFFVNGAYVFLLRICSFASK